MSILTFHILVSVSVVILLLTLVTIPCSVAVDGAPTSLKPHRSHGNKQGTNKAKTGSIAINNVSAIIPKKKNRTIKISRSLRNIAKGTISTSISRRIKGFFSSDFENLIMRLTGPGDQKPPKLDIGRFIATLSSFSRNMGAITAKNNPYRVTLNKIWMKLVADDPNCVLKAIYLLHLLQQLEDQMLCSNFQKVTYKMVSFDI